MTPNPSNTVGDEELIALLRKHTHDKADMAEYRATAIALRALLASRPASEGEGWVLTDAMLEAGAMADVPWEYADAETGERACGPFALELSGPNKIERAKEVVGAVFLAMLAAAPAPPADLGGEKAPA